MPSISVSIFTLKFLTKYNTDDNSHKGLKKEKIAKHITNHIQPGAKFT